MNFKTLQLTTAGSLSIIGLLASGLPSAAVQLEFGDEYFYAGQVSNAIPGVFEFVTPALCGPQNTPLSPTTCNFATTGASGGFSPAADVPLSIDNQFLTGVFNFRPGEGQWVNSTRPAPSITETGLANALALDFLIPGATYNGNTLIPAVGISVPLLQLEFGDVDDLPDNQDPDIIAELTEIFSLSATPTGTPGEAQLVVSGTVRYITDQGVVVGSGSFNGTANTNSTQPGSFSGNLGVSEIRPVPESSNLLGLLAVAGSGLAAMWKKKAM